MESGWLVVAQASDRSAAPTVSPRRIVAGVLGVALAVILIVAVLGVLAAQRLAEAEAVDDAADTADLIAELLVQPALTEGITAGDPAALAALDEVVRDHVLNDSIVRVKLWDDTGRILYSDESRLIGQVFPLEEDEEEAFADPTVHADVSDLQEPENVYERDSGTLLEAYRPVWTPDGGTLLFESYFRYDDVVRRSGELWQSFAAITVGSLVLLVLLLLPVLRRLITLLERGRRQREGLLQRAIDASADERRRIAGTLHDGVVQELTAASFAVHAAAERADAAGDAAGAESLRGVSRTVRAGIGGLRSLLVDIYPPSLAEAGLTAALADLAAITRARGVAVRLDIDDDSGLDADAERLVFRIAHETLANVVAHSAATTVTVSLAGSVLEIADDGVGFDPAAALAAPEAGHLGLRVLRDLAVEHGARLAVRSSPGNGTTWRLELAP
ncbi:integral membrane sensor signal transduction histidine kinase [Microbacteriaceae bacterium VKM Ac-2854]|nr:integral membrane sensor signal transduction histidine kinase [Microbacteriaceae bacterium VKM Ac-2854]